MADNKDAKKEDGEAPKAKSKKKLLIIIAVAVLVVLGGGGFFAMKMLGGGAEDAGGAEKVEEEDDGKPVELLSFEPFVVNLLDNSGTRYLKVSVNLDLKGVTVEEASRKKVQMSDSIIILLSSKSYADVGSVEGKYELREEMASRINQILPKGARVKAVYFTEFVIQ
jgi:flagellar protein FliL